VHHKTIIYNKPTRCNSGIIVFNNYKYALSVVVNKHNTARVASCWFIIYYLLYYLLFIFIIYYLYLLYIIILFIIYYYYPICDHTHLC